MYKTSASRCEWMTTDSSARTLAQMSVIWPCTVTPWSTYICVDALDPLTKFCNQQMLQD